MTNKPIRPHDEKTLYDAIHNIQLSQTKMEVAIGGHPDIPDDTGLCGKVAENCEDIKEMKKDIGWLKNRIYWIMGVIAAAGLLGGGAYGIDQLVT